MPARYYIDADLLLALRNWIAMDETLDQFARQLDRLEPCAEFPAEEVAIGDAAARLDAFELHASDCVWHFAARALHRRILRVARAWDPSSPQEAISVHKGLFHMRSGS